jgi:signal transduction histidine kinase
MQAHQSDTKITAPAAPHRHLVRRLSMLLPALCLQLALGAGLYRLMAGADQWMAAFMMLFALGLAALPLFWWWARGRYGQHSPDHLALKNLSNSHSRLRVGYLAAFACIAVIIICGTGLVQQENAYSKGRGALTENANRQQLLSGEIEASANAVLANSGFTSQAREQLTQAPLDLRAALDAMARQVEQMHDIRAPLMPLIAQARVDILQLTSVAGRLLDMGSREDATSVDVAMVASELVPLIEMHSRSHAGAMDRSIHTLASAADARIHDITRISMLVSGLLLCSLLLAVFLVLEPAANALEAQTQLLNEARNASNRLVEARTADLTRAMHDAHGARVEAERANRMKSMFLANITHELRTPMHAILGFARLGQERAANGAIGRAIEYCTRIESSGERLLKLLNDLLDLARLEAGQVPMDMQWVEAQEMIRPIVDELTALAAAKQLTIDVESAAADADVHVDPERIRQVLRNLLVNAIQFTPAGKCIHVSANVTRGTREAFFEINVADQGIGIPTDELEWIFDAFVQSSKTITGAGGTGLGLSICKHIVGAHGGTLEARNNEGGGARFTVRVPQPPQSARQHDALAA